MTALPSDPPAEDQDHADAAATRRRVLRLGAVAAGAVVSIRPALAQTAGSVLNCQIPIPDNKAVALDGSLVPLGTLGAFPGSGRAYTGEEVKAALAGGQLPGTNWLSNRAYIAYVRRLQRGQQGFTCFASLQMPR